MSQKTLFKKTALAVAVAIVSTSAWSAGFQLNEFSSSGLGRAYSGEGAIADDAGNVSRNPALITMFDRPTFSMGAVYIDPDVNVTGKSNLTGQSANQDNIAPVAWVPNMHFVMPINDQFGWGASVTSNYGLATEFNDSYAAGIYGGKTDLQTINLNLSGAYRLDSNWSFGVGFDAVYAKAKIERYAGSLGPLLAGQLQGMVPPSMLDGINSPDDQIAYLKGDEWGFGWNAGILYELDKNNRWGLTYRSEVKIDFDGDYKSSIDPNLSNIFASMGLTGLPAGTGGRTQSGALTLNLPEMWEVSGYNRVAPQWAVHYSLTYTSWSQFQELKATGNDGQTLFYKDESFKDAYRIALGTTYYYDKNWTFRTGIAFDDSPVPADKRSISIPDQDRLWLSAGMTYAFNDDASIDVGASYMHGQNVSFTEGEGPAAYTFKSEGKAWLFGTNFNYAF
ncbi:long-chain fatty acid transporter FadL [Enterobacter sp. RHB15-C17]|jgi:Long-chain fatty acid transport protein|uniref:Long-chain fatty acid transport protein n=2 Tax=Enterobacteriaceae TaxID=543 RepID=A0ABD4KA28_9ENTR|nr:MULTISPECIES: long-chain fatty acid transporter FadL [Lelliottia]MDH6631823.1 long-chain fatty acid transport protein [Lelliottia amnigena]PKA31160.1 long-chain fatty acid transporter FadL [Cedecea lapagei]QMM53687.1 long-chain fatty acid transporter FadL [Enterobacter sp. RHB15-C17]AVY98257.1 long-chain fatty acid transporter FadL [Lelliottia sp. WB101]MBF4178402.1 long-chain fatty acid transporter FadL [Lelliottia nimipressuralis]